MAGGTLIEVIGSGFANLGGSTMHGSTAFNQSHLYDPLRRIDHGTFCKFSLNADEAMTIDFACTDHQCTENIEAYDGVLSDRLAPEEGQMALMDASSGSHLRNQSTFTESSTPSLGRWSSVVRATFVSPTLMLCESPPYHGTLTNHRVTLDVRVVLNGDFHDLNAMSRGNATFHLYGADQDWPLACVPDSKLHDAPRVRASQILMRLVSRRWIAPAGRFRATRLSLLQGSSLPTTRPELFPAGGTSCSVASVGWGRRRPRWWTNRRSGARLLLTM